MGKKSQLNKKKEKDPTEQHAKDLNRQSTKEDVQMPKTSEKGVLISLAITETQTKTILRPLHTH